MIDWEQIQDRILSLISIEDIINKYTCNKIVRNRTMCINSNCSGVQERTMSLKKGYAYCFRCGKNYNQIQAVMELKKCDYITACKMIISDFGLPIEVDRQLTVKEKELWKEQENLRIKERLKKANLEKFLKETNKKIVKEAKSNEILLSSLNKESLNLRNDESFSAIGIFYLTQRKEWLDWLYSSINGFHYPLCKYDYLYNCPSVELLRKIYKGEIRI